MSFATFRTVFVITFFVATLILGGIYAVHVFMEAR